MTTKPGIIGIFLRLFKRTKGAANDPFRNNLEKRDRLRETLKQVKSKPIPPRDIDHLWFKFQQHINTEEMQAKQNVSWTPSRRRRASFVARPAFGFAIAFVLLLGGTMFLYNKHIGFSSQDMQAIKYETINVEYGKRAKFTLSDGSVIVADAGSEIRYPTVFSDTRDITLKGEAYFQVAKDSQRPFIVHANQAVVQVYGTKFNVRAWDENPTVTVVVKEGKVSVANTLDEKSAVFLTKNQMSRLEQEGQPSHEKITDAQDHLGWMNYEIEFENATINEILAQLKRWYDYKIEVQDKSILNDRMTVHIVKTNVDDVLQVISLLTDSKIEKDSNNIRIVPNS